MLAMYSYLTVQTDYDGCSACQFGQTEVVRFLVLSYIVPCKPHVHVELAGILKSFTTKLSPCIFKPCAHAVMYFVPEEAINFNELTGVAAIMHGGKKV